MSWLQPSSPPRSPHILKPSFLGSYFPANAASPSSATSTTPPRYHAPFRPTRRDLILCLLTLSFTALIFSRSDSVEQIGPDGVQGPIGAESRNSAFGFSHFFPSNPKTAHRPITGSQGALGAQKEISYTESVRRVGPAVVGGGIGVDGTEESEDEDDFAQTSRLIGHAPGWTLMEDVYVYNGSIYVVTDEKESWPELRMMTSTGLAALNVPGNTEAREPTGSELVYIHPREAVQLWGDRVWTMDGTTWLFNDGQFIDHYYHFAAELLLGAWRAHSSLDPKITAQGETTIPPPRRAWFIHQNQADWRDRPGFNPTILFSVFPSISTLYRSDWDDLARSTATSPPKAYLLPRALLADRSAAFRGEHTGSTARTVAGALRVGTASRFWWEPIRRQVLRWSGASEMIIDRNLEGVGAIDPVTLIDETAPGVGSQLLLDEPLVPLLPLGDYKPVVTYISRQSSRRRLTPAAHLELVASLSARAEKLGWELVIIEAERLSKEEQFVLAGRTTVMVGVHGNGLSHLLWMPATPRSTVIEMFFKGGFARDYQWTAHALGHRHFAVQHDVVFTAPNLPSVDYPEGFQGEAITVDGDVVADLIEGRLSGKL